MNADIIRQQISNLLLVYPELSEDDLLRADMIEGETKLHEFLRAIEGKRRDAITLGLAINTTITDLKERQARFARREEAMRALMMKMMDAAALRKVELPEATLSIGKPREKVVINDEGSVPIGYCHPPILKPDKTKIRAALDAGETFNWAALVTGEPSLSVRTK